jgi:hypothetical protein
MKMSTSSGGLSSAPVGGERGAAVAAVAAGSMAAVDFLDMAACQPACRFCQVKQINLDRHSPIPLANPLPPWLSLQTTDYKE